MNDDMKRLIKNLIAFILTLGIGLTLPTLRPLDRRVSPKVREAESYAVYSVVLKELQSSADSLALINDTTSSGSPYKEVPAEFTVVRKTFPKAEMPEILRDYSAENLTHHSLTSKFALTTRYELVKDSGNSYANADGFFTRYPNARGIIALSAVGFNSQMDHALVYVRQYCVGECGGALYWLSKQDGRWAIAEWQLG